MSSTQYASLTEYNDQRTTLIEHDRSLRVDSSSCKVSPSEAKADAIVRELRTLENTSIWGTDHEGVPHPFPGMEFLTGGCRS